MNKNCTQCATSFTVTDEERAFYEKASPVFNRKKELIPEPTLCVECRFQRRVAHRNERTLSYRTCDKTQKKILSAYSQEKPFVVYEQKEWWKDDWDARDYGQDIDFNRPFFEQFAELQKKVPRMALQQENNENSDYTNNVSYLKDCYWMFSSDYNRDCCFGTWIQHCQDCYDALSLNECEQCYECVYSKNLYNCQYSFNCSSCRDSMFLFDCYNCKDCFMCWGLQGKQYYILNKPYSKEKYFEKLHEFPLSSYQNREAAKERYRKILKEEAFHPPTLMHGNLENSDGDLLVDCQNCHDCYHVIGGKDCQYVNNAYKVEDMRDCSFVSGELAYESCECFPSPYHSAFNLNTYRGSNLFYCDMCMNDCKDCFGCVGLKKAQYCILNKQYHKDEYEEIVPKLIEHMRKTGEWGEFFPINISPYSYNESQVMDYFPLSREEVKQNGWRWKSEEKKEDHAKSTYELPDLIEKVQDDIRERILIDESGKPYKIIPQELQFYRKMGIPIPRKSPEQRHLDRLHLFNSKKLWDRSCPKCGTEFKSTFAPESEEKVLCKECYYKNLE